ncbi:potassium-transporting ATPase subunit KdpA [Actinoplanes sp. TFC3]|uniref:potassium-transporting ATPase subunit KdpA n=1 Tax=Actinoplanes sp. TFC3 TaxID=1710355 RepID=UPI000833DAD5|nr:potassium-transporting ATPase subunit KdpA [Actinoplanes sp. TFC3]
MAGWIFPGTLVLALVVVYRPFGDYLYRAIAGTADARAERVLYRLVGVDPKAQQTWGVYARSVLAFSVLSVLFLYILLRVQDKLWLSLGLPPVTDHVAWNTAVSFVSNTNWQAYSGESTMGHLAQMAGLAVQNFVSASVGIAVAVALIRGFAARKAPGQARNPATPATLGNFWVDLTRITLRILVPVSVLFALVFMAGGVVQNLSGGTDATTLTGATQHLTGGPVASQEVIKLLGTNGGGFYNTNSAHPYENPATWTNWLQVFLILLIPFSLPRVFGRMAGQNRQGYAIVAVMAVLAIASTALTVGFELHGGGTVPQAAGAAMEGKDVRFGVPGSATFAAATTLTSTGAVNSFHDSYTSLGGMMPMVNMMLGEVAPGGTGSGLYGLLVLAIITVFVAGLMVGRTPEYLGKKIGAQEMKLASSYFLVTPALVLTGTATAFATGHNSTALNTGPHALSEVLYAFTSAANNNGSAFGGITVNTPWWDTALGLAMLLGRFLPIVLVLALAGALAEQQPAPETEGTMPTHQPLFVGMVVGVTVVLVALTFLPALALGPIAEALA